MSSVSVIMPIKNRFDLARTALLSVVNQTVRPNQIVLIDDGSDVCVLSALAAEIAYAKSQCVIVSVLVNQVSIGVSASRNKGIKCATEEYIAFCDSDDYWIPQKLEFVMELINKYNANVVVHSFAWIVGRHWMFRLIKSGATFYISRYWLAVIFFLNVSCCVISKDCINDGFRLELSHHEDLDFFLTISENNRILFVNFPFMCMGRAPGSAGGLTSNSLKMAEGAIKALDNAKGDAVFLLFVSMKLMFVRIKIFLMRRKRFFAHY